MGIAPAINRAGRQTDAHAAALEWPVAMTPAACALIDEPAPPSSARRQVNTPTTTHRAQSAIIDPTNTPFDTHGAHAHGASDWNRCIR